MKKIFVLFISLFLFQNSLGAFQENIWKVNASCVTSTADSVAYIPLTQAGDRLISIVIGDCGGQNSSLIVYDSSGAAANQLTPRIDTSTSPADNGSGGDCRRTYLFHTQISSGITYTTVGTASVGIYFYQATKIFSTFSGNHLSQ